MRFNEKIICGCLLTFSILTLLATVFIVVFDLIPSMKFAKTYIPSNCKVLNNDYINTTIISNQKDCIDLNSEIWWYNVLGENDFYDYVVQHKNSKNNNNSNNSNSDNNNNNNNNNSSSSSSSLDSSSSDSSYDDNDSFNNNTDSNSDDHSHNPNERICYQGLFEVEYQIDNSNEFLTSNISGTWSVNLKWVHHYLNAFSVDESYQCFYQSTNNLNVNWFGPAKISIFSLVGVSVGGGFSLICLILFIVFYRKFKGSSIKNPYLRISPDGTHTFY